MSSRSIYMSGQRVSVFIASLYNFSNEAQTEILGLFKEHCHGSTATCRYEEEHGLFEIVCNRADTEKNFIALNSVLKTFIEAEIKNSTRSQYQPRIQPISKLLHNEEDLDSEDEADITVESDPQLLGTQSKPHIWDLPSSFDEALISFHDCPAITHCIYTPGNDKKAAVAYLSLDKFRDGTLGRILLPPDTLLDSMNKLCKASICCYSSYNLAKQAYVDHMFSKEAVQILASEKFVDIWNSFKFRQKNSNDLAIQFKISLSECHVRLEPHYQDTHNTLSQQEIQKWNDNVEFSYGIDYISAANLAGNRANSPTSSTIRSDSSGSNFLGKPLKLDWWNNTSQAENKLTSSDKIPNRQKYSREDTKFLSVQIGHIQGSPLTSPNNLDKRTDMRGKNSVKGSRRYHVQPPVARLRGSKDTDTLIYIEQTTTTSPVAVPPGFTPFVSWEDANPSSLDAFAAKPLESSNPCQPKTAPIPYEFIETAATNSVIEKATDSVVDRLQSNDDEDSFLSKRTFMRINRQQKPKRNRRKGVGNRNQTFQEVVNDDGKISVSSAVGDLLTNPPAAEHIYEGLPIATSSKPAVHEIEMTFEDTNDTTQYLGVASSSVIDAVSSVVDLEQTSISKSAQKKRSKRLYLAGIHKAVSNARNFHGQVHIELQLGKVLIQTVPHDLKGKFSPEEFQNSLYDISGFDTLPGNFSHCITTQTKDIERILDIISTPSIEPSQKDGWWELACHNLNQKEIRIFLPALDCEATNFDPYYVEDAPKLIGAVYLHFPHQTWDARLAVIGKQGRPLSSDKTVESFVNAISIKLKPGDSILLPILEATETEGGLHIKSVRLYTSAKYTTLKQWDQHYLKVTRVHDMVILRREATAELGCAVSAISREEREMIEEQAFWYEVSIGVTNAPEEIKENEQLNAGKTTSWTVEKAVNDEAYVSMERLARKLVENMDDVGLSNRGWGVGYERKMEEQQAKQKAEEDIYW